MSSRRGPSNTSNTLNTSNTSVLQVLGGITTTGPTGEQALHPSLVAAYRLRVVAVGVLLVTAILAALVVDMALPGHGLSVNGFEMIVALGVLALGGMMLTPWNRFLSTRWGIRALYAWSAYVVFLVAAAVYLDGGQRSSLELLFAATTVFFAIAYSLRAQVVLYGFSMAMYVGALALSGWGLTTAGLYVRLVSLGLVAYVASVLSGWLVSEMRDRALSTGMAEQRAGMLDTVAQTARRISSLDPAQVMGAALEGAIELGCHEAEVWLLEGSPSELQLQRCLAPLLTELPGGAQHLAPGGAQHVETAVKLFQRAQTTGTTQIVHGGHGERLVACLLQSEGHEAGLFLVRMSAVNGADSLMVECIELLSIQVSTGLDVARNVAERRDLQERLAHWAFHDSLTDLPNRMLFADRLELALARAARTNTKVAVLFLDLDGFKAINDTLGHAAGDQLLVAIAQRLQNCLRPNDTLARYGGDEFVVLVEEVESPERAIVVAQRILNALVRPIEVTGSTVLVRTSIGIALAAGQPGADVDALRRADMAMYEAKNAGGSGYVLSSYDIAPDIAPEMEHHVKEAS